MKIFIMVLIYLLNSFFFMQIQAANKGMPLKPAVASPYRSAEAAITIVMLELNSLKSAYIITSRSSYIPRDALREYLSPLSTSLKKLEEEVQALKSTDQGLQNFRKTLSGYHAQPVFSIFFDTKVQPEVIISDARLKVDELLRNPSNPYYFVNAVAKIIYSFGDDASSFLAHNRP